MYISWGTSGDHKPLSAIADPAVCPNCRAMAPQLFSLVYRYFHFYHIFGVVTQRQYLVTCEKCQSTREVEKREVPPLHLASDPVPYSHRYGLFFGAGLVAAVALGIVIVDERKKQDDEVVRAAQAVAAQKLMAEQAAAAQQVAAPQVEAPQVAAQPEAAQQAADQPSPAAAVAARPQSAVPPAASVEAAVADRARQPGESVAAAPARPRRRPAPAPPAVAAAADSKATPEAADTPPKKTAGLPPVFRPEMVRAFPGETQTVGGTLHNAVREAAPNRGMLVGLQLGLGKFGSSDVIGSVQAIYVSDDGESLGRRLGEELPRVVTVQARPGYAIGAVAVKAGMLIDGLAVYFMRVDGNQLDTQDVYASEWVGGTGGAPARILGGDGRPAMGLVARMARSELTGLGLRFGNDPDPPADEAAGIEALFDCAALPAEFQIVGLREISYRHNQVPSQIMIAALDKGATAHISIDYEGPLLDPQKLAKGYISRAKKAISSAKMELIEKHVPDLNSATFEKPLVVDLTGEGDGGKRLLVHEEILFSSDKAVNVLISGPNADEVAALTRWAQTIKLDTLVRPEPQPRAPRPKKQKSPASADPGA